MKEEELIKVAEKLEFHDGGDGVEWELWIDKKTDKLYRVPIEIVRDFSDKEEVCCYHEAKFGSCDNHKIDKDV